MKEKADASRRNLAGAALTRLHHGAHEDTEARFLVFLRVRPCLVVSFRDP